jgi:hypothetical protein
MQFPEHGSLVPGLLEELGKGHLGGIKRETVVNLAMQVTMLSGQYGSPGRRADGICHAGIGKEHPFTGDPVNVWCLDQVILVSTDGLVGMIVRHDEYDVGG